MLVTPMFFLSPPTINFVYIKLENNKVVINVY